MNSNFDSIGSATAAGIVRPISKVGTGIRGLDDILEGGLPEDRITVVTGQTGTGKTILGLEFAYRSAVNGEPVIFISFEERADVLRRNAHSIGWDLAAMEEAGMLFLIDSRPSANSITSGEFDMTGLLAIVSGQAEAIGARRLVIDSIDVLLRVFNNAIRERNQLNLLSEWLSDRGLTTIMTSRIIEESGCSNIHQYLEYMADCLIRMDMRIQGQIATRRLRVVKYRGSSFGSNEYPCVITKDGMCLLPISNMILQAAGLGEALTSGDADFDKILGGGFRRGSSIMIAGASGIGKTTFLCTFVKAACERGERVLYVSFEESIPAMTDSMRNAGIELQSALADGTLATVTGLPEAMGTEEHLVRILGTIEAHQSEHVAVDAVSAALRIGSRQAAFDFLMRLVSICKERGLTCLVSSQESKVGLVEKYGALDISTLMDSILLLRYAADPEGVKRLLFVLKSRGMPHSGKYHAYRITGRGIEIIGPYATPLDFTLPELRATQRQNEEIR